jgi:hypothetical protein
MDGDGVAVDAAAAATRRALAAAAAAVVADDAPDADEADRPEDMLLR